MPRKRTWSKDDADTATLIMGWSWDEKCGHAVLNSTQEYDGSDWQTTHSFAWAPSQDMRQAWAVAEAMADLGFQVDLASAGANEWACIIRRGGMCWEEVSVPRLAICRAALRAIRRAT